MVRDAAQEQYQGVKKESGLTSLDQACLCGQWPEQEGTSRAQCDFVCPGRHPFIYHFPCTEEPHSRGWPLCHLMGGLTGVYCWALLVPAGDDLFLPTRLPCGSCSTFPCTVAWKSSGDFSLKLEIRAVTYLWLSTVSVHRMGERG